MELQLITAEKAQCHCLNDKESIEHIKQAHFQLSPTALPSPDTSISIPSFLIDMRSETAVFGPKRIANLWTQLLSIHVQSGHYWRHEDAGLLHREKVRAAATRDPVEQAEHDSLEKGVLYLRHKIQKALLSRNQQPIEAELPGIAKFFSKLESFGDLDASILRYSKIHKVLKAILKLDNILGDETYQFKSRSATLSERYHKILESSEPPNLTTVISPNPAKMDFGQPTETPALCLTQLTEGQCKHIEEEAAKCDPPLDRGVVELMCMLPHLTSKNGTSGLQVAPMGKMQQTFDSFPELDRAVYPGGPIIPPHMFKLTFWVAGGFETAYFIDTKTGEALRLREYSPVDESGVLCTQFEGPRQPIEELLQEWIDMFLSMKMVPSGSEYIITEGHRRNWSKDYLNQRKLLHEYGWPASFPLPITDYLSLIRKQSDIYKESVKTPEFSLDHKWTEFAWHWHELNLHPNPAATKTEEMEKLQCLDQSIKEAINYYIKKKEDREYALAADVPLDTRFHSPLILRPSGHGGDVWSVEITPLMMMERFNEVFSLNVNVPEAHEMKKILDAGYQNWKLTEKGGYPRDYVDEADDDETSDYVPSEVEGSGEENDEGEEWEMDEEDQELEFDVVMLEEDIKTDIEEIRIRLTKYEMGQD